MELIVNAGPLWIFLSVTFFLLGLREFWRRAKIVDETPTTDGVEASEPPSVKLIVYLALGFAFLLCACLYAYIEAISLVKHLSPPR